MTTTATKAPSAPRMFSVPAGTPAAICRGPNCGRRIYFTVNPQTGRVVPIDCDVPGGRRPSETKDTGQLDAFAGEADVHPGNGIAHHSNCPDVEMFRRAPR